MKGGGYEGGQEGVVKGRKVHYKGGEESMKEGREKVKYQNS